MTTSQFGSWFKGSPKSQSASYDCRFQKSRLQPFWRIAKQNLLGCCHRNRGPMKDGWFLNKNYWELRNEPPCWPGRRGIQQKFFLTKQRTFWWLKVRDADKHCLTAQWQNQKVDWFELRLTRAIKDNKKWFCRCASLKNEGKIWLREKNDEWGRQCNDRQYKKSWLTQHHLCRAFTGPECKWNSQHRFIKSKSCSCPAWLSFLMKWLVAWMRREQWLPCTGQCHSTGGTSSRNASLVGENTADSKEIPDPRQNSHRCASGVCCGEHCESSSPWVAVGSGFKGISHTSSVGKRSCNTRSTLETSSSLSS